LSSFISIFFCLFFVFYGVLLPVNLTQATLLAATPYTRYMVMLPN